MRRALSHQAAIHFVDNIEASPRVIKIYSDSTQEEQAIDILRQYQDQDFSYTDAVSFAVMKQYGTVEAFAFDQHFITAGFTLIP
jgi:predicted nucleic acid-binding protein